MQLVPTITRYTCALACLESFSHDAGLFYTQEELMKYHPLKCLMPARAHEFGSTSLAQLVDLCAALDLNPHQAANPTFANFGAIAAGLMPWQAILFFVNNYNNSGNCHTVRFERIIAGVDRVSVMCPYFGIARFEEIDWNALVVGHVTVIKLSKGTY